MEIDKRIDISRRPGVVSVDRHRSVLHPSEIRTSIEIRLKAGDYVFAYNIPDAEELIKMLQLAVVYAKDLQAEVEINT